MDSKTYTIDNKTETLLYTTKHSYSYTRVFYSFFISLKFSLDITWYLCSNRLNIGIFNIKIKALIVFFCSKTNIIGGDLFVENLFYFSLGIMNNSMKISKILINLVLIIVFYTFSYSF